MRAKTWLRGGSCKMALEIADRYPCLGRAGTVVLMAVYLRFSRYKLGAFRTYPTGTRERDGF